MTYLTKRECWTQLVSEQHWCAVSSPGDHQPQLLSKVPRGSSSPLSLRKMQCPPVSQSLSCRRCCSEKGERRRCGIKFQGQLFGRFRAEHKTTSDRNEMSRQDKEPVTIHHAWHLQRAIFEFRNGGAKLFLLYNTLIAPLHHETNASLAAFYSSQISY